MITQETTIAIVKSVYQVEPTLVTRLTTGLCHYVYLAELPNGEQIVVRIATEENRAQLKGSAHWIEVLKDLPIPIPRIRYVDYEGPVPYMIYDYLPGDDLGNVYPTLSKAEKQTLALHMMKIQQELDTLPISVNQTFGYLKEWHDPEGLTSWLEVIKQHLNRSKERIRGNGFFSLTYIAQLENLVDKFKDDLLKVLPRPFFDDATTKNVLIHQGRLAGIVDLDNICFGDSLYQIALTRMSLLSGDQEMDYIDYWVDARELTDEEKVRLDFYTLLFCVDFMSEVGMKFNKEEPIPADTPWAKRLESIYDNYYELLVKC